MTVNGQFTYAEIMSQPTMWQAALDEFPGEKVTELWGDGFDQVIFSGCGSTYYLSMVAARLFQSLTGVPAQAYPASELIFYPEALYLPGQRYLLVTVSRSGTTTETVTAARIFREKANGQILGIGCDSQAELMQAADLALTVDDAQEESVAQTRSFSSMLVLAQQLAALIGGENLDALVGLPAAVASLLITYEPIARELGENLSIERFFFLGSHTLYGMACEAMLKMKEMSLSYSEAFHMLEFRHGPMSMVDEKALVVGLLNEPVCDHEGAVLHDMERRGARILSLSAGCAWPNAVEIGTNVPRWARPVLYLPVLQMLAYYRALANGQNPDRPANLTAVVSLDNLG